MKKTLLVLLIGLLLTGVAFSQGTPFAGEVTVETDQKEGGASVAELVEGTRDGVPSWTFKGQMNPGIQYPFVVLDFAPDDATKERLREARVIHFKVLGDGNRYRMEYRAENVRDYGYHAFNFNTEAGKVTQVSIQNRQFIQPSWAVMVRLQPRRATSLAIIPDDALRGGPPFEITVFDLRIE